VFAVYLKVLMLECLHFTHTLDPRGGRSHSFRLRLRSCF